MTTLCYEQWLIRTDYPVLSLTSSSSSSTTTTTDDIARSLGVPIPDNFLCPITLEIMKHPLRSRTGYDFERSAILQWIAKENCCPLTRQPLRVSDLIPNRRLEDDIGQWACFNCLPSPKKYQSYDEEEDDDLYINTCFFTKIESPPPSPPTPSADHRRRRQQQQQRAQPSPLSQRFAILKSVLFHHHNSNQHYQGRP